MAMPNPNEAAQRWAEAMQRAGAKYQRGIERVTESPGHRAAANVQGYLNGVQESASKWAMRMEQMTLEDWRRAAIDKGVARLGPGATAARVKFANFLNDFLPFLERGLERIRAMPRTTQEERIQRAIEMMRYTATYSGRRR